MGYEAELTRLMGEDDRLFVLTAENMGPCIHVGEVHPNRYLDTGITEQAMVGIAAGLAKMGEMPVIHALSAFLTMRAFEFLRTDVGLAGRPVKAVGTLGGLLSESNGPTHQAVEDIALMRAIPSMNIFCPADEAEMVAGLAPILASPEPWYIRYNTRESAHAHAPFQIGKAELIGNGTSLAILTHGALFSEALALYRRCSDAGLATRLVNMRCLRPVDRAAMVDCARNCAHVLIIEDHMKIGGLATIFAEVLMEEGLSRQVMARALGNYFVPTNFETALRCEGLDADNIWEQLLQPLL